MTTSKLLSLAQSDPAEFKRLYAEREEARRAKRRAAYAADPEKFLVQNRKWRAANLEKERARNRANLAKQKAVRDLYRQMKEAA